MGINELQKLNPLKEASAKPQTWLMAGLLLLLLGMVLVLRYQVFNALSMRYVDSDQPFMWAGAMDYASGLFYEPRFYGQNYNTFFEALVAVPFIWLGMPVYRALPLATQILFVFPFVFAAVYLFVVGKKPAALWVLCILLCMPTAFDIMSSLPRGFVGGIFFCSFFILSFHQPNNRLYLAINYSLLVIGYFVNPNSVLISLPFLLYVYAFHFRQKFFYYLSALMLVFFVLLNYVFDGFYQRNPEYVIYGYAHSFSWQFFIENIKHLDQTLAYVGFLSEGKSVVFLLTLVLMLYYLWRHNLRAFWAFVVFLLVMLLSFFSGKSRDGVVWPWYAYSRLFIGAPVVFYLFIGIFNFQRIRITLLLVLLSVFFAGFKWQQFDENLKRLSDEKLWNGVHLVSVPTTLDAIHLYSDVCAKQDVDFLLVSNGFWLNTFIDYGGPAIDAHFPQTYETRAERRQWVRKKMDHKVIERFVFISAIYDFETKAKGDFMIKKLDDYGLYLIEQNHLSCKAFIDLANKIELN